MEIPNQTCWGCKNFWLTTAEESWSEYTPGNDFNMQCSLKVWEFDTYSDGQKKFGECMEIGFSCKLFEKK